MGSPERRWRQVQIFDVGQQYEEADPTFVAVKYADGSEVNRDGWRPLAYVWKWAGASMAKPWRGRLAGGGAASHRDYASLEEAQRATERRCSGTVS